MAHKGYSNKAKSGAHAAVARIRQAAQRAAREAARVTRKNSARAAPRKTSGG